ncbi:hypothetical protein ACFTY8_46350 [Streptomyces mirabilis]|uniref:hypothetical protein n=1 Tax=Streptomyces mirabilis TaxID=68239 RepID=UPI003644AEFD
MTSPMNHQPLQTGHPFFELPPELAGSDTIGVIYDQVDGLNFYADYGGRPGIGQHPALQRRSRRHRRLHTDHPSVR